MRLPRLRGRRPLPKKAPASPASPEGVTEEVELRLIEQDHRLLFSGVGLIRALFERPRRPRRIQAYSIALFVNLFSSAPMAATAGVALVGLLVALHANKLLSEQNTRLDQQNALAEAERRSGLIFELSSVLDALEKEREQAVIVPCSDPVDDKRPCDTGSGVLPTRQLVGRIVALSQGLRPYRFLEVEGSALRCGPPERFPAMRLLLEKYRQSYVAIAPGSAPVRKTHPQISADELFQIGQRGPVKRTLDVAAGWLDELLPSASIGTMTCRPTSPERGQLLLALMGSGVDLSAVAREGVTFSHANVSHVRFDNLNLGGVDLSYAALSDVSFANTNLLGANLRNATITSSDFADAEVSVRDMYSRVNDFASLDGVDFGWVSPTSDERDQVIAAPRDGGGEEPLAYGGLALSSWSEPRLERYLCAQWVRRVNRESALSEVCPSRRTEAAFVIEQRWADGQVHEAATLEPNVYFGAIDHDAEPHCNQASSGRLVRQLGEGHRLVLVALEQCSIGVGCVDTESAIAERPEDDGLQCRDEMGSVRSFASERERLIYEAVLARRERMKRDREQAQRANRDPAASVPVAEGTEPGAVASGDAAEPTRAVDPPQDPPAQDPEDRADEIRRRIEERRRQMRELAARAEAESAGQPPDAAPSVEDALEAASNGDEEAARRAMIRDTIARRRKEMLEQWKGPEE